MPTLIYAYFRAMLKSRVTNMQHELRRARRVQVTSAARPAHSIAAAEKERQRAASQRPGHVDITAARLRAAQRHQQ